VLPATHDAPVLFHGDCLDVLATFEPASFDAFVDDPPAGIAFMGKAWDDLRGYKPRTERGREVFAGLGLLGLAPWAAGFVAFMFEVSAAKQRVAKPGAHSLSWALPRTSDLTMLAMRLAGWEIRDVVTHLCGQGMGAKGKDISKEIDKLHGAEREVVGRYQPPSGQTWNLANDTIVPGSGGTMDAPNMRLRSQSMDITAPATDDARKWDGWHTTLSPAAEYWILARAPMTSTVARNVLEHGTGAINIDATRTATNGEAVQASAGIIGGYNGATRGAYERGEGWQARPDGHGRWPKNAVLSCALACEGDRHSPGCPRRMLDEMSGHLQSGAGSVTRGDGQAATFGKFGSVEQHLHGDSGGASRFFPTFGYYPKASDRSIPGRSDIENTHPTHKSPDLMRWLIRLVTPRGARLLDCFMGSGTTGVACAAEGVAFVGIEADPGNFEIARARILAAHGSPEYAAEANAVAPTGSQLSLI
jgi:DNA modification methylase